MRINSSGKKNSFKRKERIVKLFKLSYLFPLPKGYAVKILYGNERKSNYYNIKRDILKYSKPIIRESIDDNLNKRALYKKRDRIIEKAIEIYNFWDDFFVKKARGLEKEKGIIEELLSKLKRDLSVLYKEGSSKLKKKFKLSKYEYIININIWKDELEEINKRLKILDEMHNYFFESEEEVHNALLGIDEKLQKEFKSKKERLKNLFRDPEKDYIFWYLPLDISKFLYRTNVNLENKKVKYEVDIRYIFKIFKKNTRWMGLTNNQYSFLFEKTGLFYTQFYDFLSTELEKYFAKSKLELEDFLGECFNPKIKENDKKKILENKLIKINDVEVFSSRQVIMGETKRGEKKIICFNIRYPKRPIDSILDYLKPANIKEEEIFLWKQKEQKNLFIKFLKYNKILPKDIKINKIEPSMFFEKINLPISKENSHSLKLIKIQGL